MEVLCYQEVEMECNSDLVDRISDLPDSILAAILSFLPTEEAVSTVLLSKRWIFLWRTVHNLDFYQDVCGEKDDKKFVKFVNKVLQLHDSGLLNEFGLCWDCCHVTSHTYSWINTALRKNVRKLSLFGLADQDLFMYDVPVSVFRCDSLRSLELVEMTVRVSDTLVVCLPRLESLTIHEVLFESGEACEKLISGCPKLDNMYLIIGSDELVDFEYRISSTSLKRLEIDFLLKSNLKLNASSLEYLRLGGSIREIIIERNLSSLVEACVDHLYDVEDDHDRLKEDDYYQLYDDDDDDDEEEGFPYNSFVKAIRAFSSAQVLTLSDSALKVVHCASICLSTKFNRLVELKAETDRPLLDGPLQDIIRNSDNLEVLTIHEYHQDQVDYVYFPEWTTPVKVPKCWSSSLKRVHLRYDTCSEDECEKIRLMLEHGSVLEVVEICIVEYTFELTQTISAFPKKSPVCEVRFSHILQV